MKQKIPLSEITVNSRPNSTPLALFTVAALWSLFVATLVLSAVFITKEPQTLFEGFLRIDHFTLLLWSIITLLSALVATYSQKYLAGFRNKDRFMVYVFGFTVSVMLLPAAGHVIGILFSWFSMGLIMSGLIGVDFGKGEAREAAKVCRGFFLLSTCLVAIGVILPAIWNQAFFLPELLDTVEELPATVLMISSLSLICAAIIQSALFPFHRWLLSSMTAPTPASALMHAGFVNGAGVLLTMFAPLFVASGTLTLLVILGGVSAVLAQFSKLLQVNLKQKLACSTIAQMGFMILQCGLGFFNAAIAHLILHGFYKAYLFLSSGEGIRQTQPIPPPVIRIRPLEILSVLINGILATFLFAWLTGKGTDPNTGMLLTLVAAITVGQLTYNIVKQRNFSAQQRILGPLLLYVSGIASYALVYNGVSILLEDRPLTSAPQPISWEHLILAIFFLIGFFTMKLGTYLKFPWLYVRLLNLTQPFKNSVLKFQNKTV